MSLTPLQYAAKLDRLAFELTSPEASEDLLHELGKAAKGDVKEGVKPDVGGGKFQHQMDNWPRRTGNKTDLGAFYTVVSPTVMEVKPDRYSAGPFAMLENGRRPRRVGQFTSKGRGRGKGGPYTRLRVVARTVGPMAPKNTWSDAEEVVVREFPPRLRRFAAKRINRALK